MVADKLNQIKDTPMVDIITPIFMCVVMPVAIVWLVMRTKQNETNKMAEIMLKAIEAGTPIDPDYFRTQPLRKSIKERLLGLLTASCLLTALGVCSIRVGIIFFLIDGSDYQHAPTVYTILLPLAGSALLTVGLSLLLVYFIKKKHLAKEIEAEEKALEAPKEK